MCWIRRTARFVPLLLFPTALAAAQRGTVRSPWEAPLSRAAEIALARSAAPASVSADATVLALEGESYVVAEEGTNGFTCYVSRSHPQSLEPHCFDAEGSATILPIHLRRAELRAQGLSDAEIDAEISQGIARGDLRLPSRPVLSYMMSAGQVLYNDAGTRVGRWRPHVMIYYPDLDGAGLGLDEPHGGPVYLFRDGGPTSSLVIIVPDFVEPEAPAGR